MVFLESIRKTMREKSSFEMERFDNRKEAVIVITGAVEAPQYYVSLFFWQTERQLLRYSAIYPHGKLPWEIRLFLTLR